LITVMKKSESTPLANIPGRFTEPGRAFIEAGRSILDPTRSAAPRAIWLQGCDFLREAAAGMPDVYGLVCDYSDPRSTGRVLAQFQAQLQSHPFYAGQILAADSRWQSLDATIGPVFEKWFAEYQQAQAELARLHRERDQAERELERKRAELETTGPVAALSAKISELSARMLRLVTS
jgi:hypothetical protein